VDKKRRTLEDIIDKMIAIKRKHLIGGYDPLFEFEDLSDVYGTYKFDDYSGRREGNWRYPSSPLFGEKNRTRRRLRKIAKSNNFFTKNGPTIESNLKDIFQKKFKRLISLGFREDLNSIPFPTQPKELPLFTIEDEKQLEKEWDKYDEEFNRWSTNMIFLKEQVDFFIIHYMLSKNVPTKKMLEKIIAAYTYYVSSQLTERQVVEEINSLFPNITRKTLRKWVKLIEKFENHSLG
jgi:hypothetical protein